MTKVISLSAYRSTRQLKTPQQKTPTPDNDLDRRLERIKASIVRINQLMSELRSMDNDKPNRK